MGYLFEQVCSIENLTSAFNKSGKKNKRPGPDGVSWHEIELDKQSFLFQLRDELIKNRYVPEKDMFFQKPYMPGSEKQLNYVVLNIKERIVEYAIKNVLAPLYENEFIYFSCAYRVGKGDKYFDFLVNRMIEEGYYWFLSVDIKSYYNSINHCILINEIYVFLNDFLLVELIKKCLGVKENGFGIPVGHILSTFFSNVFLHPVDLSLIGRKVIRYADNYCFAAQEQSELAGNFTTIQELLKKRQLALNPDKTKILYKPCSKDLLT